MENIILSNEDLKGITHRLIFARAKINIDKLENVFREMSLLDYEMLERIWPDIIKNSQAETKDIYLDTIQKITEIPMNKISGMVQVLSDKGLVNWERGESGTYIRLNSLGREKFKKQQDILVEFMKKIVQRIGYEKLGEMLKNLNDIENIILEEADSITCSE